MITTLYADPDGAIYDAPFCRAAASNGAFDVALTPKDLIPLPSGSQMMYLPGREATCAKDGSQTETEALPGKLAVAAILPVGYTRTHLPAYRVQKGAPMLPLYGYTAAALYKNKIYVAAVKTDDSDAWNPARYNTPSLRERIKKTRHLFPQNRLVEHLANCSLNWGCCTAQNIFYRRFEAGIPASPACNADCLGCISLQSAGCCPAPQSRITFTPSPAEIAEIGVYHLKNAPGANTIISFGQGCEGEPSLAADTIATAIGLIRADCPGKGRININTNAGFTAGIKKITDAGLDSMRVSMISAREPVYQAYHRAGYRFAEVAESINYAKSKGVYVSLNLLLFPGLTDRPEETASWIDFIKKNKIDMAQLRNLNIDPDFLLSSVPPGGSPLGVRQFIRRLRDELSRLKIGNSTPVRWPDTTSNI